MAEPLLDRAFQMEILQKLAAAYPDVPNLRQLFHGNMSEDHARFVRNVHYLHDHKLIEAKISKPITGAIDILQARITATGLDFISDDGGLSAVLGVVTVKLHQDTIKDLLIKRVEDEEGDETVKRKVIDKLKGLPAEATQQLASQVLEAGIQNLPNAVHWLRTLLGL